MTIVQFFRAATNQRHSIYAIMCCTRRLGRLEPDPQHHPHRKPQYRPPHMSCSAVLLRCRTAAPPLYSIKHTAGSVTTAHSVVMNTSPAA